MKHIAIILDGNRRYAKLKKLPAKYGHLKGVEKAEEVLYWALDAGVSHLSYFLFSKDNWKRTDTEVSDIFGILENFSRTKVKRITSLGICVNILGDRSELPKNLNSILTELVEKTSQNTKMHLNLAINYSGKWDILQAAQKLVLEKNDTLDYEDLSRKLETRDMPDPDIMIRTGGDTRISNFFLWQMAYTELFFVKSFFPDFSRVEFEDILKEFDQRSRRFGGS